VAIPSGSLLQASSTFTSGGTILVGNPGGPGGVAVNDLTAAGTYLYGQSFGARSTFNVTTGATTSPYAFYTDYVFTVAPGTFDSISATIDLGTSFGINGFQARLYDYNAGASQNLTVPGLSGSASTGYSSLALAGGALDAWSSTLNLAGNLSATSLVIPQTTLGAGTYVLELRGTSVGTSGGSYAGVLNMTPVPLPAGLPLLLSGMGGLIALARRRCGTPVAR